MCAYTWRTHLDGIRFPLRGHKLEYFIEQEEIGCRCRGFLHEEHLDGEAQGVEYLADRFE